MLRRIKIVLDVLIFGFTIFLVLYGLQKGFDLIELTTNLFYFCAVLLKLILDFIIDIAPWKKNSPPSS